MTESGRNYDVALNAWAIAMALALGWLPSRHRKTGTLAGHFSGCFAGLGTYPDADGANPGLPGLPQVQGTHAGAMGGGPASRADACM